MSIVKENSKYPAGLDRRVTPGHCLLRTNLWAERHCKKLNRDGCQQSTESERARDLHNEYEGGRGSGSGGRKRKRSIGVVSDLIFRGPLRLL